MNKTAKTIILAIILAVAISPEAARNIEYTTERVEAAQII